MKLEHNFTQSQRAIFLYRYNCYVCNRSDKGLEIHHVCGRKKNEMYLSSSLNMSLLCLECHSRVTHSKKERLFLFKKTVSVLKQEGYMPTMQDMLFIETHAQDKFYEKPEKLFNILKHL